MMYMYVCMYGRRLRQIKHGELQKVAKTGKNGQFYSVHDIDLLSKGKLRLKYMYTIVCLGEIVNHVDTILTFNNKNLQ